MFWTIVVAVILGGLILEGLRNGQLSELLSGLFNLIAQSYKVILWLLSIILLLMGYEWALWGVLFGVWYYATVVQKRKSNSSKEE
jgi:hypothetical protein